MVNRIDRWSPAAGLITAPFYLALIIVLGALEPGFSHRTSLMSLLGGVEGVRGLAFNLGVVVTGVCLIVFADGQDIRRPLAFVVNDFHCVNYPW